MFHGTFPKKTHCSTAWKTFFGQVRKYLKMKASSPVDNCSILKKTVWNMQATAL